MANDPVVHVIDDDEAGRDALGFLRSAANVSTRIYESAYGNGEYQFRLFL